MLMDIVLGSIIGIALRLVDYAVQLLGWLAALAGVDLIGFIETVVADWLAPVLLTLPYWIGDYGTTALATCVGAEALYRTIRFMVWAVRTVVSWWSALTP